MKLVIPSWIVVRGHKMICLRCHYFRYAVIGLETRTPRKDVIRAFARQHNCGRTNA